LSSIADSLVSLGTISLSTGNLDAAKPRFEEALGLWRQLGDESGEAGALRDLGTIELYRGAYPEARSLLKSSLTMFRRTEDAAGQAVALQALGLLAVYEDRAADAVGLYEVSLSLWRTMGNRQMVATDLANLGEALRETGALDRAGSHLQEALALYDELGDIGGRAFALAEFGKLELARNDPRAAVPLLLDSLRFREEIGERVAMAESAEALASAVAGIGNFDLSAKLLGAAAATRRELDVPLPDSYVEGHESTERMTRQALGDEAFVAARDAGQGEPISRLADELTADLMAMNKP
jgi:tetratricopeptide (TPR) repeat protein